MRGQTRNPILIQVGAFLLAFYLGLSPVYWLPFASVKVVAVGKLVLVATAVLCIFAHCLMTKQFGIPTGLVGVFGFLAMLVASMPGFFQADLSTSLARATDIVLAFGFMWCFYNLKRVSQSSIGVMRKATVLIFIFCIPTITSAVWGFPDWTSPFPTYEAEFFSTGFGAGRTGWSNGIAMFVPLGISFVAIDSEARRTTKGLVIYCVIAIVIIASQVVCGGRAGLVSSLTIVILSMLSLSSRVPLMVFGGALILLSFTLVDYLGNQLRISPVSSNVSALERLDRLSTGRVGGYLLAIDLISEKPLAGHGFGAVVLQDYGFNYKEIHNLWLRMAVESGVFLPLTLLAVLFSIFRRIIHQYSGARLWRSLKSNPSRFALLLTFFSGLIISMFEPNALLGSFQNTAVWWAVAGMLLAGGNRANQTNLTTADHS